MAFDVTSICSTIQCAWGTATPNKLACASHLSQNLFSLNDFDIPFDRTSEFDDIAEGTFHISNHATGFRAVMKVLQHPRVTWEPRGIVMNTTIIDRKVFTFNKLCNL